MRRPGSTGDKDGVAGLANTYHPFRTLRATTIASIFAYFYSVIRSIIHSISISEVSFDYESIFIIIVSDMLRHLVAGVMFFAFMAMLLIVISATLNRYLDNFLFFLILFLPIFLFMDIVDWISVADESFRFYTRDCQVFSRGQRTECGYDLLYKGIAWRVFNSIMHAFIFFGVFRLNRMKIEENEIK